MSKRTNRNKIIILIIIMSIFIIFIDFSYAQVLNEILPNPSGDDNNKEFVEVYTQGINLSGYIIGDESGNDTLTALQYKDGNYTLIVEEGFQYQNITATIFSAGATIGNNLGNTGDTVFLYAPNSTLIDSFSYNASMVSEGRSIERNNSGWFVGIENTTPGFANSISLIHENNGIVSNATQPNNTVYDGFGAYTFDGKDDYINIGDNASLNTELEDEFTVTAWVYPLLKSTQQLEIIGYGGPLVDRNFEVFISHTNNRTALFISNGTNYQYLGNESVTVRFNAWNFIAVRYKKGEDVKLRVNNLAGTRTPDFDLKMRQRDMYIGSFAAGHYNVFSGTIDDLRIFNESLTDEQIQLIYENKTNLKEIIEKNNSYEKEKNKTESNTKKTINTTNIVNLTQLFPNIIYINQTLTKGFRINNLQKEKINVTLQYTVFLNNGLNDIFFQEKIRFEDISRYRTKDTVNLSFFQPGNYTICGSVDSNQKEDEVSDNTACTNITVLDFSSLECDRTIAIFNNQSIYKNKVPISFAFLIGGDYAEEGLPFTVSYSIAEFNGKVIKQEHNTSTTKPKKWTPNIKKHYGAYILTARLTETTCNDTNTFNNFAERQFLVENTKQEEGLLSIEHIYLGRDNVIRTGEVFRAKILAYTGNLTRLSSEHKKLLVFVKDSDEKIVSPDTQITAEESFEEIELIVPVFLEYSCESFPAKEEKYTLVAQGFGTSTRTKFPVSGIKKELCSQSFSEGEYPLISFSQNAKMDDIISSNITIYNLDDTPHTYKISSKVYRGPKTYSGDFFENQQIIHLNPWAKNNISLTNVLKELKPGRYKTKIQIQKDEQKTIKQFTNELIITSDEKDNDSNDEKNRHIIALGTLTDEITKDAQVFAQIYGEGEYTLIFDTALSRENRSIYANGTSLLFFDAALVKGKNNIILSIFQNETLLESKPLILFAGEEIEEIPLTNTTIIQSKQYGMSKITGYAVLKPVVEYKTSFYKIASLLNYFLIALLLLFVIFLIFQKAQPI